MLGGATEHASEQVQLQPCFRATRMLQAEQAAMFSGVLQWRGAPSCRRLAGARLAAIVLLLARQHDLDTRSMTDGDGAKRQGRQVWR